MSWHGSGVAEIVDHFGWASGRALETKSLPSLGLYSGRGTPAKTTCGRMHRNRSLWDGGACLRVGGGERKRGGGWWEGLRVKAPREGEKEMTPSSTLRDISRCVLDRRVKTEKDPSWLLGRTKSCRHRIPSVLRLIV